MPEGALALVPRAPWMLEDDFRSDAEADEDWRSGTQWLFPTNPNHILLIYQSHRQHYVVLSAAPISRVVNDAAVIFALDPTIITLLSGGRMLSLTGYLSDPPAVLCVALTFKLLFSRALVNWSLGEFRCRNCLRLLLRLNLTMMAALTHCSHRAPMAPVAALVLSGPFKGVKPRLFYKT